VPSVEGGAKGVTFAPSGQIGIDNAEDTDNLTLAHENMHEFDLRKDGVADIEDGADINKSKDGVQRNPTGDTQGAYGPKNIMNYGDTGDEITAEQAAFLN
jgi:hypothetical protein